MTGLPFFAAGPTCNTHGAIRRSTIVRFGEMASIRSESSGPMGVRRRGREYQGGWRRETSMHCEFSEPEWCRAARCPTRQSPSGQDIGGQVPVLDLSMAAATVKPLVTNVFRDDCRKFADTRNARRAQGVGRLWVAAGRPGIVGRDD